MASPAPQAAPSSSGPRGQSRCPSWPRRGPRVHPFVDRRRWAGPVRPAREHIPTTPRQSAWGCALVPKKGGTRQGVPHRSAKAAWHALGAAANVGRPAGINPVCRQTDAGCVLGVGDAAACFPLAVHAGGAVFAPTLLHERWGRADQVESPFAACSRSSTVSALTIVPPPDLTSLTDRDACHGRSFVIHYTPLGVLELDGSDPSPT